MDLEQNRVETMQWCPCSAITLLAFEMSFIREFCAISLTPNVSNAGPRAWAMTEMVTDVSLMMAERLSVI